jgi:hypothetical protein
LSLSSLRKPDLRAERGNHARLCWTHPPCTAPPRKPPSSVLPAIEPCLTPACATAVDRARHCPLAAVSSRRKGRAFLHPRSVLLLSPASHTTCSARCQNSNRKPVGEPSPHLAVLLRAGLRAEELSRRTAVVSRPRVMLFLWPLLAARIVVSLLAQAKQSPCLLCTQGHNLALPMHRLRARRRGSTVGL